MISSKTSSDLAVKNYQILKKHPILLAKSRLLITIIALGFMMPLLALRAHDPFQGMMLGFPIIVIMVCAFTAFCAVLLIPSSAIEWLLFKNKNIFKNWWHAYRINVSNLVLTSLFYLFFLYPFMFLSMFPDYEFMESATPIMLSLSFAIIFVLTKLWCIKNITNNSHIQKQLIFLSFIPATMFGLIIYLLVQYRLTHS